MTTASICDGMTLLKKYKINYELHLCLQGDKEIFF